jgi:hypothetical protein
MSSARMDTRETETAGVVWLRWQQMIQDIIQEIKDKIQETKDKIQDLSRPIKRQDTSDQYHREERFKDSYRL